MPPLEGTVCTQLGHQPQLLRQLRQTVCTDTLDLAALGLNDINQPELPQALKRAALRILARCVEGWSEGSAASPRSSRIAGRSHACLPPSPASLSKFDMRALTGGMSNAVFCCEKGAGRRVLLRCYGLNSNAFFDRSAELLAFKYLARNGLGPQLLGEFANGRIEEFLDAETLTPELMRAPRMSARIARQVAAMHALRPAGLDPAAQLLRTLQRWHVMARGGAAAAAAAPLPPAGDSARPAAAGGGGGAPVPPRAAAEQLPRSSSSGSGGDTDVITRLDACVAELRARLAATPSPTVFCHNDLQYGNVMYTGDGDAGSSSGSGSVAGGGGLYLIDYEYASYNPRGFDVGNHFCEWCADYRGAAPHALDAARFPSDAQRRAFCAAYLGESDGAAAAPRVDALMREAQEYALASHVLWACWGLAQARGGGAAAAAAAAGAAAESGGAGFDYAAYARGRLELYLHFSRLWPAPAPVTLLPNFEGESGQEEPVLGCSGDGGKAPPA